MSVHVSPEPHRMTKDANYVIEDCVCCRMPTTYWHRQTNTPLCESCAFNVADQAAVMAAKAAPKKTVAPA